MNGIVPPKCHTRHEALFFSGFMASHLPAEMTDADMEYWRNHPEGLAAILVGLKARLKMPAGEAIAPLHVASPLRATIPAPTLRSGRFGEPHMPLSG